MEVVVTLKVQGVHRWASCPMPEVFYLRDYHRHEFHIKCYKHVEKDDREIEILMFKSMIEDFLRDNHYDTDHNIHYFGDMSCEMIAKMLFHEFQLSECEVLEDGENGARYKGFEL